MFDMFQDVLVDTAACADSYKRSIVCKFQTRPYGACYFRWTPFLLIVGVTIGFRGAHVSRGPNDAWHIDGYDKLARYGFSISG